jgi:8-oxo-dGTP pyrophosphatase MutT (NUDIX family)
MADHPRPQGRRIGPWTRLSSRRVYENPWIRVREDRVLRPDGSPGIYGVVEFRNLAVAVAAVDAHDRVILVGQHRYPFDEYSWEIPEGGCPEGEDPLAAARRELREETGMQAARWDYLGKVALSNSATDEIGHLYLARELSEGEPDPECTEVIAMKRVPWEEAWRMAMGSGITDILSVACLARARHFLAQENAPRTAEE